MKKIDSAYEEKGEMRRPSENEKIDFTFVGEENETALTAWREAAPSEIGSKLKKSFMFCVLLFLAALAALYLPLVVVSDCHFRILTQRVTFET